VFFNGNFSEETIMPINESNIQAPQVAVINPENGKTLGTVLLIGGPVEATKWINTSGPLQGYVIVEGREQLRVAWGNQNEVLLRTEDWQRSVKIITYPPEGESHGYLDFISDPVKVTKVLPNSKTRLLTQRGFAFLQNIFGT
jgi:hypothetical protein